MKILLLLLGAPLWLPLLIVLIAVAFSVIISLWAGVASLWAGFTAAIISAPASMVIGVLNIISGSALYGSVIIAMGIGFGIVAFVLFHISLHTTKWMCALTKKTWKAVTSIRNIII